MDLPPELRNIIIYSYAVTRPRRIILDYHTRGARPPAITQVNQQIREESLPLFYHLNIFQAARVWSSFDGKWLVFMGGNSPEPWLGSIRPDMLKHVKTFRVIYSHNSFLRPV
jgi:hypothetical protein